MGKFKFTDLKTEYFTEPLGIDVLHPVLSWNVMTEEKSWEQAAYQILAADSIDFTDKGTAIVWDSQKIFSHEMSAYYQGEALGPDTRYFWKVRVWRAGEDTPSEYSPAGSWHTGFLSGKEWLGNWIGVTGEETANPLYRYNFTVKKKIRQAFAYVSGLGHYELYINGRKAGDNVLEPGWTDYNKTCFYNTYDIKDMLITGNENVFGIMLGDGMYHVEAGNEGRYVYYPRSYGRMKLIFQAEIEYEDGTRDVIVSSGKWKTKPGPVLFSGMYGGEDYDAGRICSDWCLPGTKDVDGWTQAAFVTAPSGKLRSQMNPPLKIMRSLEPVFVTEIKNNVFLYDFGENFSGFVKLKVKGKKGQTIRITPGEILNKNREPDQTVTGKDYYWRYTLGSGEEEVWEPRFTYYGFRYVLVQAESGDLPGILEITGRYIYPDIEPAGGFSCSSELFNKIHKLINSAMLSNMKSVLTDCPHREKFGWLEESHLIGPALLCNYDLRNTYKKILGDIRDAQHENGLVPDIAPEYAVFGYHTGYIDSPEWGSASVINPWYLYKKYGDRSIIKNQYGVMKKYTGYLTGRTHHKILHHGLGDWCDLGVRAPFTQNTPIPLVATPIYYIDLDIMRKSAALLGFSEEEKYYERLMEEVKTEFNLQFYDDQTAHYGTGSQAAQALALMAGLVEKDQTERVVGELAANIRANRNGTTAGDVGHPYVLSALTKYGRSDVINDMMNVTDRPGYGYQVVNGATTLTEEWDGPDPEGPHGSQNHFMLGSGDEWFYTGLAGIRTIRSDLDTKEIEIVPYFAKGIDWVKAWQKHPYGRLSVEWRRTGKRLELTLIIPAGARGRLELPAACRPVTVNGLEMEQEKGIKVIEEYGNNENAIIRIKAGSGSYHFLCNGTE